MTNDQEKVFNKKLELFINLGKLGISVCIESVSRTGVRIRKHVLVRTGQLVLNCPQKLSKSPCACAHFRRCIGRERTIII